MNTIFTGRSAVLAIVTLFAAAFTALPAAAQNMKPGLWEVQSKMGGEQGAQMAAAQAQMQQQMASMPPEQRKMIQDIMAGKGISMSPGTGGGMAVRVCITKEMAARNEAPTQRDDCKQEQFQRNGNTTKFKFTCSNPPSSGEGTVTFNSPESYTMHMKMTGGRQPGTMTMDAQGKFISSDCGSVKPIKG